MSELCRERRWQTTADGGQVPVAVLAPAGLTALFDGGWRDLARRLDGDDNLWFVSESRARGFDAEPPPTPCYVADEAFEVDARLDGPALQALLYVHPGLRWFSGHFPGQPILPGVVLVGWAGRLAVRLGYGLERFSGLSGIKFTATVAPGTVLSMHLTASGERVTFQVASRAGGHCRGTLHYRV